MPLGRESQERKKLFYEFCNLVSPSLLKMGKSWIALMPLKLVRSKIDLLTLVEQSKKFKEKHPNGIEIKEEIPIKPIGGSNQQARQYKQKVVYLLEKYTGIEELREESILSCNFYETIINDIQK